MELKQRISYLKSRQYLTIVIVLSIFTLSVLVNQYAFAKTIEIKNNLDVDLIFNEIENRQDVKIKSEPPSNVKSQETGQFEVGKGDSEKPSHLKVQYYVGEKGASETVSFGFKGQGGPNDWNQFDCFTNTPDDIKGSQSGCNEGNTLYTFSPK